MDPSQKKNSFKGVSEKEHFVQGASEKKMFGQFNPKKFYTFSL